MSNTDTNLTRIYAELGDLKNDFRNKNLIGLVEKYIKGSSVLEVGCGNGILLNRLNQKGKEAVGIEPNHELFKIAQKNNPNSHIINGRAEDIDKLVQKKFDNVVMMDVLEHIENDAQAVNKTRLVLNDGGHFIIVVPAYQFAFGRRDESIGHFRRYSKKSLAALLKENNFEIVKIRYWGMIALLPYLIAEKILKKPLNAEFRSKNNKNPLAGFISKLLDCWFKYVENNVNFGFGLSLICEAKKITKN